MPRGGMTAVELCIFRKAVGEIRGLAIERGEPRVAGVAAQRNALESRRAVRTEELVMQPVRAVLRTEEEHHIELWRDVQIPRRKAHDVDAAIDLKRLGARGGNHLDRARSFPSIAARAGVKVDAVCGVEEVRSRKRDGDDGQRLDGVRNRRSRLRRGVGCIASRSRVVRAGDVHHSIIRRGSAARGVIGPRSDRIAGWRGV